MNNYEIVNWGEVINIKNGRSQEKVVNKDGLYPIYGSGGIMGYADDYLCIENTVIIGRKGSINNPIYVTTKFWNVDTAFGLETDKEKLDSKYLFYFCQNYNFEKLNTTVTIPSLTKSNLLKIKMKLPPIDRQREIVAHLDKAADLVKLNKRRLEELDNLIKSVYYEMFGDPVENNRGWEKVKFQNLIISANNGLARRGNIIDQSGNIVIRLKELQAGYIDYSSINRITLTEQEKKRYLLENNDLLFARVNGNPEYVGRCALFKPIGENVYHNDHIIRVVFDQRMATGEYLTYLLNSNYGKKEFKDEIKTSAGQYTINQVGLGNANVICPPIQYQIKFSEIFLKINEQKSRVKNIMSESENLFNSLMSKYFD